MTTKNTKKIGRRDMLKLMSAGVGGIAVSAFLPKKWTKPVVAMGQSAPHAQASITTGTITGIVYAGTPIVDGPVNDTNVAGSWFPLSNAVVTVDGMPALTSTTGQNGVYTILNVPIGSRAITCVPPQSYYLAYNPNPASNVAVNVTGISNSVQDFYFENIG